MVLFFRTQRFSMLLIAVILLASLVASFTDWLFMDMLVHNAYAHTPNTWRAREGTVRIIVSQIIGTVATAATVLLYVDTPGHPLKLAGLLWCAGALPVILQNAQWIKMSPMVAASHAAGWLARPVIATSFAWWLLAR